MFLEEIIGHQQQEVAKRKTLRPLSGLEKELKDAPTLRPFQESLLGKSPRLIAELKKASPSKGLLCPNFNPAVLAGIYETAGAAAISVLTEEHFFQGSLENLALVKEQTRKTPLLRKDFIIDSYQLYEARLKGADAVLLIVAALTPERLHQFIRKAQNLGMAQLVEVHNRSELEIALNAGAGIIGINNRDLHTFAVDVNITFALRPLVPKNVVVVAESGIRNRADIQRLGQAGVHAVLVGESLVTAPDPGMKIRELLGEAT